MAALLALSLTPAFAGMNVGTAAQANTLKPVFDQYANLITSAPQWLRGREVSCARSSCTWLGAHPWVLAGDYTSLGFTEREFPAVDTGPVLYNSTSVFGGTVSIVSTAES